MKRLIAGCGKKSASGVLASLRDSTYRSVRLASSLTAALLDGLFAHPASYSDTNTTRELIAVYYTTIVFFRSFLGRCEPDLSDLAEFHMLLGFPEIMVVLHGKPTLRRPAKRLGKT